MNFEKVIFSSSKNEKRVYIEKKHIQGKKMYKYVYVDGNYTDKYIITPERADSIFNAIVASGKYNKIDIDERKYTALR